MAKKEEVVETGLYSASVSAARAASLADLIISFSEREKPKRTMPRATAEARLKATVNGKTASQFLVAWDGDKALGFMLFTVCAGLAGEWAYLNDAHIPKGPRDAAVAKALLAALLDWAKARGLERVGTSVEPKGDAMALCDEFGFTRDESVWREKFL
ncbi:MAG: GNAT family N-acetyltransferase [Elusimicrobiota bacterium]|nr:GNAT family N-acetyltransferase [Elusimicrobiota bacterium]